MLFPQNLAEPVTVIFAREVLEEDGDLKKRLIGTGPYILKEHTRKVRVVLARNPDYFDKGRQYLDEYVILSTPDAATRLAAFRTGQSDILWVASLSEAETVRKTNSAAVVQGLKSVLATFGLTLAQDKPPFNDVRVRRAISMAIDRQKQVDTVFEGHGILGWGVPYIYYQDTMPTAAQLGPWWQYRPAEAKKLLAEAGHPNGFETTLFYYEYFPQMTSQVQLVQQDLKKNLNINLKITKLDYTSYYGRYVDGQVGRDGLGVPVGPRGGRRRADLSVHALQVDQELLPRQRPRHRRAGHQAAPDTRSRRAARDHEEDRRSRARPGVADVDAGRRRLPGLPALRAECLGPLPPPHRRLRIRGHRPSVAR